MWKGWGWEIPLVHLHWVSTSVYKAQLCQWQSYVRFSCWHELKLCWHTVMEVSFISLLSCNQLSCWHELLGGGPSTPIGHQELRVEVTWAMRSKTPTQSPLGHQELRVEVPWAMRTPTHPIGHQELRVEVTSNEEEDPHPHWSSGDESWSDMSNEECQHTETQEFGYFHLQHQPRGEWCKMATAMRIMWAI